VAQVQTSTSAITRPGEKAHTSSEMKAKKEGLQTQEKNGILTKERTHSDTASTLMPLWRGT